MKQFIQWCSKHPLVWGVCVLMVGILGSLIGQSLDDNQPFAPYVIGVGVVMVVMWVHMSRAFRKSMTIVTLLSFVGGLNPLTAAEVVPSHGLLVNNQEVDFVDIPLLMGPKAFPFAEEKIPYLVGGLVIVAGTAGTIYLYRLCKRVFNTNAPAASPNSGGGGGGVDGSDDNYAMSVTYSGHGYCYEGGGGGSLDNVPLAPVLMQIELVTEDTIWGTEIHISGVHRVPVDTCSNNPDDYKSFTTALGLNFQPDVPGQSFGVNGEPASAARVPMSFDPQTKIFNLWGGSEVNFTLQRSANFEEWVDLVTFTAPGNRRITIEDETEGRHVFYRMKTVIP